MARAFIKSGDLDRVRFAIGTAKVFQGYHRKGEYGMVAANVWVTADTLRLIVDHVDAEIHDDFDRIHNPLEAEHDRLAFGDTAWESDTRNGMTTWTSNGRLAPDGATVLYPLTTFEATIVQRFDPTGGRTYDRIEWNGDVTKVPMGVWVTEDTIDSFNGGVDGMVPEPVGFVADAALWAEGRSDTPPIETEASRKAKPAVLSVTIEYTTGKAEMTFEPVESNGSGTSYDGVIPEEGQSIEEAVSMAISTLGLWPK